MRSRHEMRESNQKIRTQLKAVTNTAITHDPIPHASPITTTVMALPVSLGLSSTVRKRSSAPIPKMTNANVVLTPLNSATTAPTIPNSTSVLRSSRFESDSTRVDRGCHATTQAQATAKAKLSKSLNINSGCLNCSRLCCMDSHESPFGSIPPPIPLSCLAISSAGLAPNAICGNTHTTTKIASTTIVRGQCADAIFVEVGLTVFAVLKGMIRECAMTLTCASCVRAYK